MKKSLRLLSLSLAPNLLLLLLITILVRPAVWGDPAQASGRTQPVGPQRIGMERIFAVPNLQQTQLISTVVVTHGPSTFVNIPIRFTATITTTDISPPPPTLTPTVTTTPTLTPTLTATVPPPRTGLGTPAPAKQATSVPPPFFNWFFGDGSSFPNEGPIVTHPYTAPGTYTVTVIAVVNEQNVATGTVSLTVSTGPQTYLPLLLKDAIPPPHFPDLVCDNLDAQLNSVIPGGIFLEAEIINQGEADADGFWVDLYINPTTVPTTGNLIPWRNACGGPASCANGLAWGISNDPLVAGESRTFVSVSNQFHPDGYDPPHSIWSGALPPGTYNFYVYADSIDNPVLVDTDGAVDESDETNNRCDLLEVVVPAFNARQTDWPQSDKLPARPRP